MEDLVRILAALASDKRIKNWTFFKRDEAGIEKVKRLIGETL